MTVQAIGGPISLPEIRLKIHEGSIPYLETGQIYLLISDVCSFGLKDKLDCYT